jgi:hypothetical protein
MPLRQLAPGVPEFFQVNLVRPLRRFHAERNVAALTGSARDVVALLQRLRQREERFRCAKGTIDHVRIEPMVAHDGEAKARVAFAHRPREAGRIGASVAQR